MPRLHPIPVESESLEVRPTIKHFFKAPQVITVCSQVWEKLLRLNIFSTKTPNSLISQSTWILSLPVLIALCTFQHWLITSPARLCLLYPPLYSKGVAQSLTLRREEWKPECGFVSFPTTCSWHSPKEGLLQLEVAQIPAPTWWVNGTTAKKRTTPCWDTATIPSSGEKCFPAPGNASIAEPWQEPELPRITFDHWAVLPQNIGLLTYF